MPARARSSWSSEARARPPKPQNASRTNSRRVRVGREWQSWRRSGDINEPIEVEYSHRNSSSGSCSRRKSSDSSTLLGCRTTASASRRCGATTRSGDPPVPRSRSERAGELVGQGAVQELQGLRRGTVEPLMHNSSTGQRIEVEERKPEVALRDQVDRAPGRIRPGRRRPSIGRGLYRSFTNSRSTGTILTLGPPAFELSRPDTASMASRLSASSRRRGNRQSNRFSGSLRSGSTRTVRSARLPIGARKDDQACIGFQRQPPKVAASQSEVGTGWAAPLGPETIGRLHQPVPKWCCQSRLTRTRAVKGWRGSVKPACKPGARLRTSAASSGSALDQDTGRAWPNGVALVLEIPR